MRMTKSFPQIPEATGLFNPDYEKDSCGVGFICDIKGRPSNSILREAEQMNCCMEHRGGVGFEKNTGDGAGILTALPHGMFARIAKEELDFELPQPGTYGAGNVFLPQDPKERVFCKTVFEEQIRAAGQVLLGWREMPIDPNGADIGSTAHAAMPHIEQLFIGAGLSLIHI